METDEHTIFRNYHTSSHTLKHLFLQILKFAKKPQKCDLIHQIPLKTITALLILTLHHLLKSNSFLHTHVCRFRQCVQ